MLVPSDNNSTDATLESRPAMVQTPVEIILGLMADKRARSGLLATACTLRPNRVRFMT